LADDHAHVRFLLLREGRELALKVPELGTQRVHRLIQKHTHAQTPSSTVNIQEVSKHPSQQYNLKSLELKHNFSDPRREKGGVNIKNENNREK
jgi:hypothetical protein